MSKAPTPQAISDLLAGAGFGRGVTRPESEAAAGFAVIPNRPGDGIVLVTWWPPRSRQPGERADRYTWLERYADAISAAGYSVRDGYYGEHERLGQSTDYLIVTGRKDSDA